MMRFYTCPKSIKVQKLISLKVCRRKVIEVQLKVNLLRIKMRKFLFWFC